MQRRGLVADPLLRHTENMWNIQEALDWLAGLEFFGVKLGLEQTRELFRRIGSPERKLRFIHIAGSNGKGSTGAFLESALRNAGFRTGFYSSPHLVDVNERFMINGVSVDDNRLAEALDKIRSAADAMKNENGMRVTYFEATTAAAALLFAGAEADFAVWETGMGGRLDATSIVTPVATAITTISMEHKEYLGDTIGKIAFEKAGIIKPGIPLFLGRSIPQEAYTVIAARAKELNASVIQPPEAPENAELIIENGIPYQTFDGRKTRLQGRHQRENLLLAECVLRYLAEQFHFDFAKAARGFANAQWSARFQVFPGESTVFDGAHNPECAEVLASTLKEVYPGEKFDFIYGTFADKDCTAFLKTLVPLAASFTFVKVDSTRPSRNPQELAALVHAFAPEISCKEAELKTALEAKVPHRKVLCGSLHLCGEALALRRQEKYIPTRY